MPRTRSAGSPAIRPSPVLIAFLFAVVATPEVSSTLLVRLLGDLGINEQTARSSLDRMRRAGDLVARREGRRVILRPAGVPAAALGKALSAYDYRGGPTWDGVLHGILYTIPERHRAYRDALRRAASLAGYGALRPGLMVCHHDEWQTVLDAVGPPPDQARVYPVSLTLDADTVTTAAAEAWDLREVAERIREVIAYLRTLPTTLEANGKDAFVDYISTLLPVFQLSFIEPRLPDELLGPDWPMREFVDELHRLIVGWYPPVRGYLASLAGAGSE